MPRFDWNGQSTADEYVNTFDTVRININGQSVAKLSGSAPRVEIELIDGQSLLDLSQFRTSEVVATGKIDGQSTALLRSEGEILFNDKIDGQSRVTLCAGGSIEFAAKIDGQSQVWYSSTGPVRGPEVNGRSRILWQGQAPAFIKIDGHSTVSAIPAFLTFDCREAAKDADSRNDTTHVWRNTGEVGQDEPTRLPDERTGSGRTDGEMEAENSAPIDAPVR
jgi:hypothetical protein